MTAFNVASTRRVPNPWGMEVKKRLIGRGLRQDDLVRMLREGGFEIDKHVLANLLYGIGGTNRQPEIREISRFLDIPYCG